MAINLKVGLTAVIIGELPPLMRDSLYDTASVSVLFSTNLPASISSSVDPRMQSSRHAVLKFDQIMKPIPYHVLQTRWQCLSPSSRGSSPSNGVSCRRPVQMSVHQKVGYQVYHQARSEEHTSELQSRFDLVCRLL